jgi:DHA2 family multidrug resistance protein
MSSIALRKRTAPTRDRPYREQAYILAFSDTFYTLGAALIVALLAGLLLQKPDRLDAGGAH